MSASFDHSLSLSLSLFNLFFHFCAMSHALCGSYEYARTMLSNIYKYKYINVSIVTLATLDLSLLSNGIR